jgi:hypothetical protein
MEIVMRRPLGSLLTRNLESRKQKAKKAEDGKFQAGGDDTKHSSL